MGNSFNLIWLELLLGFMIPLAFGFWQLRSVKKERAQSAQRRALEESQGAEQKSD
jgi:cbb3-type cytochrome oxidase subunit 3